MRAHARARVRAIARTRAGTRGRACSRAQTRPHAHARRRTHACASAHAHARTHARQHARTRTHAHAHAHACARAHARMRTRAHAVRRAGVGAHSLARATARPRARMHATAQGHTQARAPAPQHRVCTGGKPSRDGQTLLLPDMLGLPCFESLACQVECVATPCGVASSLERPGHARLSRYTTGVIAGRSVSTWWSNRQDGLINPVTHLCSQCAAPFGAWHVGTIRRWRFTSSQSCIDLAPEQLPPDGKQRRAGNIHEQTAIGLRRAGYVAYWSVERPWYCSVHSC